MEFDPSAAVVVVDDDDDHHHHGCDGVGDKAIVQKHLCFLKS